MAAMANSVKPVLKKLPLPAGPPDLPVLRPNPGEFSDLGTYLGSVSKLGQMHGAVRVVPPEGYRARLSYENAETLIRCFGSQSAEGECGLYQLSVEEAGSMYLSDLQRLLSESDHHDSSKWSEDPRAAEIEFWRTLGTGAPSVYTAHSMNSSLFEKTISSWNLSNFEGQVKTKNPRSWQVSAQGINGLSFGMTFTSRGLTCSEEPFCNISYLHFGKPRTVYVIPPSHRKEMVNLIGQLRPGQVEKGMDSSSVLAKSPLLIDPVVLSKHKIPLQKATQQAGEFLILFPGSYSCSFCHGVNCFEVAEASMERLIPAKPAPAPPMVRMPPAVNGRPDLQNWSRPPFQNPAMMNAAPQLPATMMQQARMHVALTGSMPTTTPWPIESNFPGVTLAGVKMEPPVRPNMLTENLAAMAGLDANKKRAGRGKVPIPSMSDLATKLNTTPDFANGDSNVMSNGIPDRAILDGKGAIRRRRKRKPSGSTEIEVGKPEGKEPVEVITKKSQAAADNVDKNKNCHFCEHAPKRCSIFACLDPSCDQMFCENCCKRHLGRPTSFKGQADANAANWRCPICTRHCCCTLIECNKVHLHCKRYRRRIKHNVRKGIQQDYMDKSDTSSVSGAPGNEDSKSGSALQDQKYADKESLQDDEEDLDENGGDDDWDSSDENTEEMEKKPLPTQLLSDPPGGSSISWMGTTPSGQSFLGASQSLRLGGMNVMGSLSSAGFNNTASARTLSNSVSSVVPQFLPPPAALGTPNSAFVGTPGAYGLVGTPLGVGTPLTPIMDSTHQVSTPFGYVEDSLASIGSFSENGPANCSWFDHLFGSGAGDASQVASMLQQQQLAAQHLQLPGLTQPIAAHQALMAQLQGQQVAAQQALAAGAQQRAHGTLEDTTTTWAPDEFVFSPQDEEAEESGIHPNLQLLPQKDG